MERRGVACKRRRRRPSPLFMICLSLSLPQNKRRKWKVTAQTFSTTKDKRGWEREGLNKKRAVKKKKNRMDSISLFFLAPIGIRGTERDGPPWDAVKISQRFFTRFFFSLPTNNHHQHVTRPSSPTTTTTTTEAKALWGGLRPRERER